jgi:hypothetical protein
VQEPEPGGERQGAEPDLKGFPVLVGITDTIKLIIAAPTTLEVMALPDGSEQTLFLQKKMHQPNANRPNSHLSSQAINHLPNKSANQATI